MEAIYKPPRDHLWEWWKNLGLRYGHGGYFIANTGRAGIKQHGDNDDEKLLEEIRCRFDQWNWDCYSVPCTDYETAQRIMIAHRFKV